MTRTNPLLLAVLAIAALSLVGCSRSGKRTVITNEKTPAVERTPIRSPIKTIVKMKKVKGVYEIPAELNGVPMDFIFDTGASLVSVSEREIAKLHDEGRFSFESDVTGSGDFVDANGDISEGTLVVIRTITIGDRTLTDVEASVVHNMKAPLLMGQSVLGQFGIVSIDYRKNEITFE